MNWITTRQATIEAAHSLLDNALVGIPIWVRWYRTFDNPHGGGPFGKSKEYCTAELVGVTAKRLKLKDHQGVHSVDPKHCFFAERRAL